MIEMHVAGEVGEDPFKEPPSVANANESLDSVVKLLQRIANYSERQREKAAPDAIDLSPTSGSAIASVYQTKTALRVIGMLFSYTTATEFYSLQVGSRGYPFKAGTSGDPIWIPFPIDVARGIDLSIINVTTPGAVNWRAIVFAYPMDPETS